MTISTRIWFSLGFVWVLPATLLGFAMVATAAATMGWHPDVFAFMAVPGEHSWLHRILTAKGIGGFSIGNVVIVVEPWYLTEPLLRESEAKSVRQQMAMGPLAVVYHAFNVLTGGAGL